jgi:hypothetical protein
MARNNSRQNKRRFSGNRFVKNAKKSCTNETHQNCANSNDADAQSISSASVSASSRKINVIESPNATKESLHATGYRFIDIEILSEVFQQVLCKECGESSSLVLEDKKIERKGCASHLRLRCEECGWVYKFYSSKKVKKSFEYKRLIYAMRSIGKGHASMKRFCIHMDMPPPAYQYCNI